MAKYVIQDIIPPEKKRRIGVKKVEHTESHSVHKTTPHHKVAIPAHKTHATTHHAATKAQHEVAPRHHTVKKPIQVAREEEIEEEPLVAMGIDAGAHDELLSTTEAHEEEPATPEESIETHNADDLNIEYPEYGTFTENPKTMLVNQLMHDKVRPQEELLHHAESPFSQSEETHLDVPESGVWPYNEEASPTDKRVVPPQFPQYEHLPEDNEPHGKHHGWMPWIIGSVIVVILGGLAFFGLSYFGGATISVIPKHDSLPLDQAITAQKTPGEGELGYVVVKETLSDTREVPATGEKTTTAKASGKILVYNEQTVIQKLIKNTRFQSSAGKIYRINESITVPKQVTAGGKTTPGSIEVTIYADEAGPDYNTEAGDFTIPGLKSTPQFTKVYGRSKGAISGGASGTTKSVSDQDLKQAGEDLRVGLETKLRTKARADLAPSQITYDGAMVIEMGDPTLTTDAASADKAMVTESGTLYLITFDRTELARAIATALIPTYAGEDIEMKNLDTLAFTLPTIKGDALWSADKITFNLKGDANLSWVVNQDKIKKDILGTPKTSFNTLMTQYPTVEKAKATLRPIWGQVFPNDVNKIKVEIVEQLP